MVQRHAFYIKLVVACDALNASIFYSNISHKSKLKVHGKIFGTHRLDSHYKKNQNTTLFW